MPPTQNQIDRIEKQVQELHDHLIGTLETPGINMRLDRLEQTNKRHQWWLGTGITAALGALATAMLSLFCKH